MPLPYYTTTTEGDIVVFERVTAPPGIIGYARRLFRGHVVLLDGQHVEVHAKTCGCGCTSLPLTPSRTS